MYAETLLLKTLLGHSLAVATVQCCSNSCAKEISFENICSNLEVFEVLVKGFNCWNYGLKAKKYLLNNLLNVSIYDIWKESSVPV